MERVKYLPKQLDYSELRETFEGIRTREYKIQANENSLSIASGVSLNFNIPCGISKGFCMDPHKTSFEIRITLGATHTLELDPNIAGIIRAVQITMPDGTVIANNQNYSALNALCEDMFKNSADRISSDAILSGNDSTNARVGEALAAASSYTFHFTLYDLINMCDSYIPLGLFGSGNLAVRLELNSIANSFHTSNSALTCTINNAYINAHIVDFPNYVMDAVIERKKVGNFLYLPFQQFENIGSSIASGATSLTVALPFKKISLQAIFGISRKSSFISNSDVFTNTARNLCLTTTQWYYTLDGEEINGRVDCTNDSNHSCAYKQLLQALHKLGKSQRDLSITPAQWVITDDATSGTGDGEGLSAAKSGGYIFACDLSKHTYGTQVNNGTNVLNSDIRFTWNGTVTAANNLDFYGLFDSTLAIDLSSFKSYKIS